jgi:peptide/nickel transport system substrate-binding protein
LGTKKLVAVAATFVAGALALSACTPQPAQPRATATQPGATQTQINTASAVSVMWNQPLYSMNNVTTFGNATANANIVYLTNDNFMYYDKALNMVPNTSYGTYEKTSDDPLTVKMTLADTAMWSDGTPVTPADVILAYGAQSGLFNTVTDADEVAGLYNEDGTMKEVGEGQVYFDSSSAGLQLIKDFPVVDGKSVTITYSKPFADWEQYMTVFGAGLPAHIVGKRALGIEDPTQAAQAVLDAFKNKDATALSKISNVWNLDWNFVAMPTDPDLTVVSGAYTMTDYKEAQYLTLTKNANYKGSHVPSVETITVRYNEDPMAAVQALQNDEVQLISPQATADVLTAAQGISGVQIYTGDEGTFEHVDLTFNNGGPFDPKAYGGDAAKAQKVRDAFLLTIPRQAIIDNIIKPINPNAAVRNSFFVVPSAPNYPAISEANGMGKVYAEVDIDKAKALLDEVGATGAKAPKVRLLYGKSNVRRQQEFRLIQESAAKAGIEVIDNGNDDWGAKLGDKSYDASLFGWQSTGTGVTESDANYRTGGNNNFGGYSNKKVDGWLTDLQTAIDPADQLTLVSQIEKQLVDDAFGVSIFQFPSVTAYSGKLTGIDPVGISPTIFWNFWEWKIS